MVFHWAATLIDLWIAIRARVVGAWRALPGDAMGLVVSRACGVPAGARRAVTGADGTTAILIEHSRTGRYLDQQRMPVRAQTLGRFVLSREPLTAELIEHELEHVRQWGRLGPLYLPAYFASSGLALARGRDAYRANRFEEAARRAASLSEGSIRPAAGRISE